MPPKINVRSLLGALLFVAAATSSVCAQDKYPTKPINVIVPFAAGGNADVLARIVGDHASKLLGQPFIFENRTGAGGNTGVAAVAKANPDGYTLGIGTTGPLTINPHLFKEKMPFDAIKDVKPLMIMATQPNLIVVNNALPVKTLAELIAYLKANPDKESYASSGVGTSQHLCMELLAQDTGIKMAHVPYRASNQIMQDLMAGHVKITCDNFASAYEQVKAGTLRGIAVTSPGKYPGSPEIPTAAETIPGFEVVVFHGYIAPAGLPDAMASRVVTALQAALKDADVQAKLNLLGVEPSGLTGAGFSSFMKTQYDKWHAVIDKAGIKL